MDWISVILKVIMSYYHVQNALNFSLHYYFYTD